MFCKIVGTTVSTADPARQRVINEVRLFPYLPTAAEAGVELLTLGEQWALEPTIEEAPPERVMEAMGVMRLPGCEQ